MKSGYFTIMWNRGDGGASKMNHIKSQCSSKGGGVVYVVDSGGSPAVGAPCGKPAGYWQQVLLPMRPTESTAQGKESGIHQQRTPKL